MPSGRRPTSTREAPLPASLSYREKSGLDGRHAREARRDRTQIDELDCFHLRNRRGRKIAARRLEKLLRNPAGVPETQRRFPDFRIVSLTHIALHTHFRKTANRGRSRPLPHAPASNEGKRLDVVVGSDRRRRSLVSTVVPMDCSWYANGDRLHGKSAPEAGNSPYGSRSPLA